MPMPLKSLIEHVSPRTAAWLSERQQLNQVARVAAQLTDRSQNQGPGEWVTFPELQKTGPFWSNQKRAEILPLLEMLQERQPQFLCEIGTYKGGTLFLFCQAAAANARIVSIDIDYPERKKRPFRRFARRGQRLHCLEADSQNIETVATVKQLLAGQPLDFLFIDGDHSYQGVETDFELYSALVRPGGLIAFHDIVPDHGRKYGIATPRNTGEVPTFWAEIKQQFKYWELVEDPEQDGYGIGVIEWQPR